MCLCGSATSQTRVSSLCLQCSVAWPDLGWFTSWTEFHFGHKAVLCTSADPHASRANKHFHTVESPLQVRTDPRNYKHRWTLLIWLNTFVLKRNWLSFWFLTEKDRWPLFLIRHKNNIDLPERFTLFFSTCVALPRKVFFVLSVIVWHLDFYEITFNRVLRASRLNFFVLSIEWLFLSPNKPTASVHELFPHQIPLANLWRMFKFFLSLTVIYLVALLVMMVKI